MKSFALELQQALEEGCPFAVLTLLKSEGHVPQDPGAKALVSAAGLISGTVGGGKVEAKLVRLAMDMLGDQIKIPRLEFIDLQRDLGMTCGGSATFSIEPVYPTAWQVAVFGAGHIAQALVPLLGTLDCRVTVIDPRPEWLNQLPENPRLSKVCTVDTGAAVAQFPAGTHFVVVTQGHGTDLPVLKAVLRRGDCGYVGVIGSSVKRRSLRAALLADGFSEVQIETFETPMGLPLGTNSPPEIAISIVARLLQIRDQT